MVQNKRNTAKGLQALINGKYIVQDSYIDALVYAATPSDLEAVESLSPLEEDFDAAWPDPAQHLPPPGKEPVHRPAKAFAPNPNRANVFEGYTFVFCDPSQFENLQPPINNGHGKALLFQLEYGKTKPEELVQFMRNAAGEKGPGSGRQGNGGVVLVRFRAKGEFEEWSIELGNQVALMTDQHVIEQSEFLDAILNNDASLLCRPLPREEVTSQVEQITEVAPTRRQTSERITSPPPAAQSDEASSQPAPTQASRRSRSRPFVSKVKTFDDGFDINSIPEYTLEKGDGAAESNLVRRQCHISSSFPNLSQAQSQANAAPASCSHMEENDDGMADLLPGANAMKRRREEMGIRVHSEETSQPKEEIRKPKRQKLDVLEAARRRREEVEAAARGHSVDESSSLQVAIEGMTLDEMKKLVVVEEMDIPVRRRPSPTMEETERWDERWNGRKNFKKFRRKGEPRTSRARVQTVIVPLEEVQRKHFGIGDRYWTTEDPEVSGATSSRRSTQQNPREASQTESGRLISVSQAESREPTPQSTVRPTQKRPREIRDDSDDEELRFRFRRKR